MTVLVMGGCGRTRDILICYNCSANWGAWARIFDIFRKETGITVPPDNRNTGEALASALAERAHPVADVMYLGGQGGIQARALGVTAPWRPTGFARIPTSMKDPDGYWFAVHSGTIGFFVNVPALEGLPVPRSWHDLLDRRYAGMIGYFDPGTAAVGLVSAMAVNLALGGTYDDWRPGLAYLAALRANAPIVVRQTAYARVLSGEIPILIDFDFNAYRARYRDHAPVQFVIPAEGSASFPYVMAMLAGAPHPDAAHRFLDFLVSPEGQKVWAESYLRPIMPDRMPAEIAARFLPPADYARAVMLDLRKIASLQAGFVTRYRRGVSGR